jgi:hypothetical protein
MSGGIRGDGGERRTQRRGRPGAAVVATTRLGRVLVFVSVLTVAALLGPGVSASSASLPHDADRLRSVGAERTTETTEIEPSPPPQTQERFGPTWGRPFTDASAWNTPIPSSPVLDARSRAIAEYLGGQAAIANLEEYGVPVFDADESTPRHRVACTRWRGCDLEDVLVPIPADATPAPGGDGAMVVIDWSTRNAYEFYGAERHPDGSWTAGWGGVISVDSDGYKADSPHLPTGAGVSRLAGVVRAFEVAQGEINHALVFSTDNACARGYRYPAAKTDGLSTRSNCIPEGSRIQLDPSIDVERLPDATPAEKMVARALQTYGAYAVDNGGARIAVIFEPPYGQPDPYPAAGFPHDYPAMPNIPWQRLRVLHRWNGR